MAESITLTVEDVDVEFTVTGTQTLTVTGDPVVETLTVVDDAPDHGQQAGLFDDDHPQYITFVVSVDRPTTGLRPGLMWIPAG